MCRRSGWGLDSCGKLCCARSPYTATDPSNKYFFGKHPNPTARTDANLCWEALPSPPCGLNEYRTETGGDCKAVKVTCGDGAEVVDGECVAKVACGAGMGRVGGPGAEAGDAFTIADGDGSQMDAMSFAPSQVRRLLRGFSRARRVASHPGGR